MSGRGGNVEFLMPRARVTIEPEKPRFNVDAHVVWAVFAAVAWFAGMSTGAYLERQVKPKFDCRAQLQDGSRLRTEHLGTADNTLACTYTPSPSSPTTRKGKWS